MNMDRSSIFHMVSSWIYQNFTVLAITATAVFCVVIFTRGLWYFSKFPSSPGPKVAIFTKGWYAWAVWKGNFEIWNINQHANQGKILRVAPNWYSIDDPDAVKNIYGINSKMPKSDWYDLFGDPRVPNHNLFSATDRKFHGQMRRLVANLYSMTAIKSYEPYVNTCISTLFTRLDEFASKKQAFNLQHWMQCYAFDVVGEITFSSQVGFMESGGQDIGGIMASLDRGNIFSTVGGIDRKLLLPLFLITGNPVKGLFTWVNRLQEARQKSREGKEEKSLSRDAEDFYAKLDTLREKDSTTFESYHAGIIPTTNITAGSDTTSISLTAVIFYLAKYPKTFVKLREEISQAMQNGSASDPITFEEAQKLKYLQAVIKEAMRLHPATGLPMWRVVQEPGETISGKFFPEKSIVGINPWVAHRNKAVYGEDALDFRPERWDPSVTAPEQLAQMERYYMPFGLGSRTCIGKNISLLEMCKAIPELVRRYDFELLSTQMKTTNHWFVKPRDVMVYISKTR